MSNNKSPGNDGLTKEFYVALWEDVKGHLISSLKSSFQHDQLSSSQRQAVIKMVEKKDRDRRLISNWRPISLLNCDTKILSKVLAERLKKCLPSLISSDQTAYVNGRVISESGRLISDILYVTDFINKEGILLTVDIQKAFDSVNHVFLLTVLKKYGFGKKFIKWIEILLNNQESCVINGGTTTSYFKLQKGTRQGDPISAYLFILVLEIAFILIKENKKIKGLDIFKNSFLYTAYADDTTFFLEDKQSVTEVMNTFDKFSLFSGLKPNRSKCEIAGIGALKGVPMALCGAKCVDLANFSIKILGVHYSYNKQVQNDQNFLNHISKIESVLKIWRMRNLTIQGKITVFKTLAISNIVHLSLVTEVPNAIVLELNKIQNDFIWNGNKPKIKHSTLCDTYDKGGLKNVNIQFKITSLQCSWIMRLYDKSDHCWKIIPLYLINNKLGKNFSFHSNLNISSKKLAAFPLYYQQIFQKWCTYLSSSPTLPSAIASQCLWYNSLILIEGKSIYNSRLSERNLNYIWQMVKNNGELNPGISLKTNSLCMKTKNLH